MVEYKPNANERMRKFFMKYRVIDRNNRQRKEYFEYYLKEVPCTYSITTKSDITAIKKRKKTNNTLFRSQFKSITQYAADTMRVVL